MRQRSNVGAKAYHVFTNEAPVVVRGSSPYFLAGTSTLNKRNAVRYCMKDAQLLFLIVWTPVLIMASAFMYAHVAPMEEIRVHPDLRPGDAGYHETRPATLWDKAVGFLVLFGGTITLYVIVGLPEIRPVSGPTPAQNRAGGEGGS